jgi:uncharacterized membrane protein
MAKTIRVEKRKRGLFGKLFALLFWVFNALMLAWLVTGINGTADLAATATSEAEQAGIAIGTTIGVSLVIGVWAFGAIILGLLSFMTRGDKIVTETTVEQ